MPASWHGRRIIRGARFKGVRRMKAEALNLVQGLSHPCADIYISFKDSHIISFEMKFSLVVNGFKNDIEVAFENPATFIWENESYSQIDLPDVLPKCSKDFSDWVYPFIEVKNSEWLKKYESISSAYNDSKLRQYALISMNDLVMVLTAEEPTIKLLNEIA